MGRVWARRITLATLQHSRTTAHSLSHSFVPQFGTKSEEKRLESAGEREQCNSYDNCGYRSIYLFILQGSELQLRNSLNIYQKYYKIPFGTR